MQGIFVSYRRQDSQSAAGRLSDHLREQLPGVAIFRDVETIDPGVDFVEAIGRALESCAVLIAVIGPRWLNCTGNDGRRRLDDPNDYTRIEVATALQQRGVRVIPVLVDGATMPATGELPPDLQALARRNAIELTDKRWEYDVAQLIKTLRGVLGLPGPEPSPPRPPPSPSGRLGRMAWIAGGVVVVLAIIAVLIDTQQPAEDPMALATAPPDNPPYVPPQAPTAGELANQAANLVAANQAAVATPPPVQGYNLTGLWADSEGGTHRIVQQGNQIVVQGQVPVGVVMGSGGVQGYSGWVNYTVNGYPLNARFTVSADAAQLEMLVSDPATGQSEAMRMWRTQ